MQYEGVIKEMKRRREDITSYMFCLFIPRVSVGVSESKRYRRKKHVPVRREILVSREDIRTGFITELANRYVTLDDEAIGLTSLVRLNNGTKQHLGLIDFHCEKSKEGLNRVRMTLTELGINLGFILDSGNSYHFVGIQSFSFGGYMDLLGKMCEFDSIGEDWPSYQISQGYADLRIIACPKRGKPCVPRLVERIENTQLVFGF